MTAKERILMIRLMGKLEQHPVYAKTLVTEAASVWNNQKNNTATKGLTNG